jgi:hypothetical protein
VEAGLTKAYHFWRTRPGDWDHSDGWHGQLRLGRLQVVYHLWQHHYPKSSDRWVFQPSFIYDRKGSEKSPSQV